MVEGAGLENQKTGNRLGGSNPSPSATYSSARKASARICGVRRSPASESEEAKLDKLPAFTQLNWPLFFEILIALPPTRDALQTSFASLFVVRRDGRVAEGGGLLNRYTALKLYRGFESPSLRQFSSQRFVACMRR